MFSAAHLFLEIHERKNEMVLKIGTDTFVMG